MTQAELLQSFTAFDWACIAGVIVATAVFVFWLLNKAADFIDPPEPDTFDAAIKQANAEPVRPHVRAGAPKDWKRDY